MATANTLFDKAAANLKTAQILFRYADDDEEQLNAIGYHLQQSMELLLKYLLEQNGIEYPKTHDIEQLVLLAKEHGVDLELSEYLDDHAEMLSQWEAKARYIVGYSIEKKKIARAIKEIDAYFAQVVATEHAEIETLASVDKTTG